MGWWRGKCCGCWAVNSSRGVVEEEGVVDKEAFRSVDVSLGVDGGEGGGGGDGGGGGGGGSMELVKVRRWRQTRRWVFLYEPWWCGWFWWPNCCQGSVTPLKAGSWFFL